MENHLTKLERLLYNKHLAVSRSAKNKPFKLKQNFDDIVGTEKHKFLYRIATLFKKHSEIDPDLFFRSPYKLYPDVEFFGLDYFSSMRAVKSYTLYKKTLFLQDPDLQLDHVKQSLSFISNFCIKNKILFHQYKIHKTIDVFSWMIHYKQNKINIYSLFEFSDIMSSTQQLAEDIQKFYLSNFCEKFTELYTLYSNSNCLKPYLKKAYPVVENFIYKQIHNC